MSLRETLNKNAKTVTMVAIGIVAIFAAIIGVQLWGLMGGDTVQPAKGEVFVSNDDGATWKKDDIKKIPPYVDEQGKETVRAHVFKCSDGKLFVGYLEKYTDAAKALIEGATGPDMAVEDAKSQQRLVKKRGKTEKWFHVQNNNMEAQRVMMVACPNGTPAEEELTIAIDLTLKKK